MKHKIDRIEVSGDCLVVTVGRDVPYVAMAALPSSASAQDTLIEAKVDAMLAAKPPERPTKFTRAEAVVARLKPADVVADAPQAEA